MSFAPLGARRSRDDQERASSIDEQRIDGALGIALFFSPFLSVSSDPFVRNFFVRTEPLAESNPVPQDPISAIHPPCIYAGDVASAMGFGLCRSKMMNGIEPIRIWILTCRWFLTVGILPGSWWAHHELGRGGWWFRDPVENASFMPRVLATARIHSVILPLLHSWTSFLNIVTFLCCVLGTFSIRSGLLASVHSFATDDTRGIFLWRFFLLMTGISMILCSQMKQQASVRRTYKKEMVVTRSTLVHLRHSARAQPRPLMLWKN
ncbi:hypothetical protein EUGRSUZ_C03075 [Eucalyptus grandis]|uniref:Cytochrome c assembly protein domain-containing protein n=2 Tax=Eucalyptus grandis TaxID=71139 RepID=A0A059CTK8_EUCGR|nr:hypothetical protein EUGRSUZ_C03075 [Eucalyptus grandis]